MKNRIFIGITFAVIVLLLFIPQQLAIKSSKATIDSFKPSLESATLQSNILYNSFMFAIMNDGINLEKLRNIIVERNNKNIPTNINKPFFIIYIPYSGGGCSSCIDYAINSVKEFFDDFSENDQFIIISQGKNPYVNSRNYRKPILHDVEDSYGLHLINNSENKPFYFILGDNSEASIFFAPNASMPDLTKRYLTIVMNRYFSETAILK